jgi:hypothetical protein
MGPLARRSPWRLARSGVWGLLVAGAFLLLASAASSVPVFAEAAGNAALRTRLASVPADALTADAPMVRIVGGQGAAGRDRLSEGLGRIPGLTPGFATAASVGVESRRKDVLFTPFVSAGGAQAPVAGQRSERARIFGDDDVAHALVPEPGSGRLPAARAPGAAGLPAVWLPAPLAADLRVTAGDQVQVGVQYRDRIKNTTALVAGVYAVGPDGRLPADPEGSYRWTYRRAALPADSEFTTLPAFLLVTDVASASKLAAKVGDNLLHAIEGQLRPPIPTLAQATATVAGIRQRQVEVRDPELNGGSSDKLREQVISGVPTIVADATRVADRSIAWTMTVGAAGVVLGLLAVLAVAVFGLVRRAVELRHAAGLGMRPATIGALAAVEVLPVAVVSSAAGLLIGWQLVVVAGPLGEITSAGLAAAAGRSALAAAAGVLLVGGAATLAAVRAAQLSAPDRHQRTVPWELLLLAVAITASAGLFLRPAGGGPPSALDLLVPVLVLAATGAVGARLVLRLAAARTAAAAANAAATGAAAGAGAEAAGAEAGTEAGAEAAGRSPGDRAWSRRPALTLAARRIAAGGPQAVLLITVLTLGFGFLIYSLAAASSVRQVTADRSAVLAGARATAAIEASWLVDPGAPQLPRPDPDQPPEDPQLPVPGARTPPLPAGTTIVWRGQVTVPPEYGNLDLLVIDPQRFAEVASWGTGPELAQAQGRLGALADADARAATALRAGQRDGSIPALGIGEVLQRPGDGAAVSTFSGDVPITVIDVLPAFPGAAGRLPTVVVPADSFFTFLGQADPRVRPPPDSARFSRGPVEYSPFLWSATNLPALQRILEPLGVEPGITTIAATAEQQPDLVAARSSTGYLVALGLCVAGLAILGLAMFAERAATRARAADLLLARMGMGRGGTGRARALELGGLALIALLLAGIGVGVILPLGARLLDPGGGIAPAFVLRLDRVGPVAAVLAALAGLLLALFVSRSGSTSGSSGEVLRDGQ